MLKRIATEQIHIDEAAERLALSEKWLGAIMNRVNPFLPPGPLKVLDVGCAQGRLLVGLARMGHDAYGVEPWKQSIEVAQELAKRENTPITIKQGYAESIPYPSNTFDLVLATSVMEHVQDVELALKEVYRVLKPGGIFWYNS